MEILHYRILNNDHVRSLYGDILSKVDIKTKETIINLLNDIKKEDPNIFGNSVDEVLKEI